jgi:hypothetical protein
MGAAIAYTSIYEKRAGKTLRPEERQAMESSSPRKRGGVRVFYFYRSAADVVYFLDIYAKSEKEDLTPG